MKPTFWQSIKDMYYPFKQWLIVDSSLVEKILMLACVAIIIAGILVPQ